MIKHFRFIGAILLFLGLSSCGTTKFNKSKQPQAYQPQTAGIVSLPSLDHKVNSIFSGEASLETENKLISDITTTALQFEGTRYKYGGSSKNGMDCSGLVYTCFLDQDIQLPRTSNEMSQQGIQLSLDEVTTGDLLFFETDRRKIINHVALVIERKPGEIIFIHSTSSRGVIISSLNENYWQQHFIMARRVI